ncbi:MAG TPA: autotransporter outer membrane beta-barrel domain-containing protein, partial [Devosiaceae bacterium]|nr:autotransporter outer membrane beta-barrel domain-containing protein [Devosiaceae bacterium]
SGIDGDGVYISGTVGSFTNSGTIKGYTGVDVADSGAGVTLTNSGLIQGTADGTVLGRAIRFGDGNDTLDLLTGARFGGFVDFAGGVNTLNFSSYRGNLVLDYAGSLDASDILPGSNLYVQKASSGADPAQVVIVNDTALQFGSQPVQDLVNGLTDLLANEFDALGDNGVDEQALNYGPSSHYTAAEQAANGVVVAPPPVGGRRVWGSVIGGGSVLDNGDDVRNTYGALVAGTDIELSTGTRVGIVGGYSRSVLNVANGTQTITGDTGFLGAYGKSDLGVVRLDYQLIGGASNNASSRQISTSLGTDTATADYAGWFIAPQVGATVPVLRVANGELSVVGRAGYIGGGFSGYTETGTAYGMTVGAQTVNILDTYAGVQDAMVIGSTGAGDITAKAGLGVFTQTNFDGGTVVPVTVLGINTAGSVAPSGTTYGVVAGFNFDAPFSANASFGAGANGSIRNDGQFAGAAHVKVSGYY